MINATGRVVVGVDGSAASIEALRQAQRQAAATGATIEAVISWEHPVTYGGYPLLAGTDWRAVAARTLDTALETALGAEAATVQRTVVPGRLAKALRDRAVGADLVVVARRGRSDRAGRLLAALGVATRTSTPVLLVRSPQPVAA